MNSPTSIIKLYILPINMVLRTIELGEDEFLDNSLDNQHKVSIKAAWGGGYTNRKNVIIDTQVDESLLRKPLFQPEVTLVAPMPTSYYTPGRQPDQYSQGVKL